MNIESIINIPIQYISAESGNTYWLTRFVLIRSIGVIYFLAFFNILIEAIPLIGRHGLHPMQLTIATLKRNRLNRWHTIWHHPSIFILNQSDTFLKGIAYLGLILSVGVACGISNGVSMLLLWSIYLSFVTVGHLFYRQLWDTLLLETGFVCIFLYPFWNLKWFPENHAPPVLMLLLTLWILFRSVIGPALTRVRQIYNQKQLTHLSHYFQNQPLPTPLSHWLHRLPQPAKYVGIFAILGIQLIAPFCYFASAPIKIIAGIATIIVQILLGLSSRVAWFHGLIMALCIPCFNDHVWKVILPQKLTQLTPQYAMPYSFSTSLILLITGIGIAYLSRHPIRNMLLKPNTPNQVHNPLYITNSYTQFGSIETKRYELVISGRNPKVDQNWIAYEFLGKPGSLFRICPLIWPAYSRLAWQLCMAATGQYKQHPWLIYLVYKLLKNDPLITLFLTHNPFASDRPLEIKIDLYEYQFTTTINTPKQKWNRYFIRQYFPPVQIDNPDLQAFLNQHHHT